MADLAETTDSTEVAAIPKGTETPANDLVQTQDGAEGVKAAPMGFDEEWLKTLDPASRQSFEEKFIPKPVFTQKTQALADDRKKFEAERTAIFELARKAIQDRPVGPAGPSPAELKQKELLELAAQGDGAAMQEAIRMEAEKLVTPIRTEQAFRNAYEMAVKSNEYVAPNWNEIYQTITTDPDIAAMAVSNNLRGASKVMIALGLEKEVLDLRPKYAATVKENTELKAKLQGYERERAAGLPSSTTRAGTTAGRPVAGEPRTLEEVNLEQAWLDAGGTRETFR